MGRLYVYLPTFTIKINQHVGKYTSHMDATGSGCYKYGEKGYDGLDFSGSNTLPREALSGFRSILTSKDILFSFAYLIEMVGQNVPKYIRK